MADSKNLVWMDLEMTGLNPETDVIIEIATLVTDEQLNIIAEGPELVISQDAGYYEKMDQWNKDQHKKSGLWEKVLASKTSVADAEKQTLDFIKEHVKEGESPLCGNSVWQDRRFLKKYMTAIDDHLHYRLIDVSSVKELCKRWYPDIGEYDDKGSTHRALDDIIDSIKELKFYREKIFT